MPLLQDSTIPQSLQKIPDWQYMHVIPKGSSVTEVDSVAFGQLVSQFIAHAVQPSTESLIPPSRGLELGSDKSIGRLAEEVDFNAVIISPKMGSIAALRVGQK